MRYTPFLLLPLSVLLLMGCFGKESKVEEASRVEYIPEYPTLPDDAPLPDQMDEAAASIDRELLEEQEKFYLKNLADIRSLYSDAEGSLLISEESMDAMADMMLAPNRVRLKIAALRFHFRAPESANAGFETTHQGIVHLLGERVPAQGEYAREIPRHRVYLHARFSYEIQELESFGTERRVNVDRFIIFEKTPEKKWTRVRIEERAPGEKI